jgi:hypothetical protein
VHQRAWAWSVIGKIHADAQPVRTKLLAYDLFDGQKPWWYADETTGVFIII